MNMIKKSKNNPNKKTKRNTKTSKKCKELLLDERPNLIINIIGLKCCVNVNENIYSPDDKKRLTYILNTMSKNILIDKTYVNFKGSRWKDAFIVEDMWYELCKLIIKTDFGRKCNKRDNEEITECLLMMAITYLYSIAMSYDFDPENIDICFKKKSKFKASYELDKRNTWRF